VINAARIGARFGILNPSNTSGIVNAAQASGVSGASVVSACWSVLANGGTATPTSAPPTTTPGANQAGWEDCASTGTVGGKSAKPTTGDTIAVYVGLPYGYLWPINLHAGVVNVSLFTTPITLASTLQMKIE
jgi:hypothetical protein